MNTTKAGIKLNVLGNRESNLPTRGEFLDRVSEMRLPYLRFSVTSDCNANCDFCHNEGQKVGARKTSQSVSSPLREEQIEYIARFFAPHFDEVKFTGGEPTLVENLDSIIRIFTNYGYESSLTTNGILLDREMQTRLRDSGLSRVNVSLGSLDSEQHRRFFGVDGQLGRVLRNLEDLSKNFEGTKINFMASDESIPAQIAPISELSARLRITVSCLELVNARSLANPIHRKLISYLDSLIGIRNVESQPDRFHVKNLYKLNNGATWEIDDFRREGYRLDAFDNSYCQVCPSLERCVEGPYALRVSSDGTLRTCLLRGDNVIKLGDKGFIFGEEYNGIGS